MTDDVKAAVEALRVGNVKSAGWQHLLAHIDGEAGRTAAAVAAAREECLGERPPSGLVRERALADRIAELEAENDGATAAGRKFADQWATEKQRAEKAEGHAEDARQFFIKERELRLAAEAERDALRVEVAKLVVDGAAWKETAEMTWTERDLARAQVEAARAWAERNTEVVDVVEPAADPWTAGYDDAITDVLAAMDGVKP